MIGIGYFFCLIGIWGILNVEWIDIEMKWMMERILMTSLMIPSSLILNWGNIRWNGQEGSSFYQIMILFYLYFFLGLPLPSSFINSKEKQNHFVCGRVESGIHTFMFLLFPFLHFVSIYYQIIFMDWTLICNGFLLLGIPLFLLRVVAKNEPLWWIGWSTSYATQLLTFLAVILSIPFTACFEYRIIFTSFFYSLALFPPWNYIAVTFGCYSFLAIILIHLFWKSRKETILILCVGGSVAAALAMGLPLWLLPFPCISSYFAVQIFTKMNKRKGLELDSNFGKEYVLFALSNLVILQSLLTRMFWFLEFSFDHYEWLSVQRLSDLLLSMMLMSFIIIGSFIWLKSTALKGCLLVAYSLSFVFVEQIMYQQSEPFYPVYLVILTTLCGIFIVDKLFREKIIGQYSSCIALSLFLSKTSLLLPPTYLAIPMTFALFSMLLPIFYFHEGQIMHKDKAFLHCILIGISAFVSRHSAPSTLIKMLLGKEDISESILLATTVIIWGIGCLPFSFRYFPRIKYIRNLNVMVLLIGICYLIIQPELYPIQMSYSGSEIPSRINFVWMEIGYFSIVAVNLGSILSLLPFKTSENFRILFCLWNGLWFGCYFSTQLVMAQSNTTILLYVLSFLFGQASLVFTIWPGTLTIRIVPFLFGIHLMLLPLLYFTQNKEFGRSPLQHLHNINSKTFLLALYASFSFLIGLVMKYKDSGTNNTIDLRGKAKISRAHLTASGSPGIHLKSNRIVVDLDWIPVIGNISTIVSLTISIVLTVSYLGYNEVSVLFLSSFLLLLNEDSLPFKKFKFENKYFPSALAISSYFFFASIYQLSYPFTVMNGTSPIIGSKWIWMLKNLTLLLFTLPIHLLFLISLYRKSHQKQFGIFWILFTPLNLLSCIFSNLLSVQILSFTAIAATLFKYIIGKQVEIEKKSQI
eukprot:TRINITY_DN5018_c0_g1_i3.p1 TRINITY_DN5018_c0_g1~~TRINITY_DN5018_c0_g1_i3.p1  ORF type:complete len:921 (-),score=128.96 TRINITY_DN5018_c0_g1_i3:184-2946(-)